jgi:hypothetical protein
MVFTTHSHKQDSGDMMADKRMKESVRRKINKPIQHKSHCKGNWLLVGRDDRNIA